MSVVVDAKTGLSVNLPDADAQAALAAGTHHVPMVSPEGEQVSLPFADAQAALQQGYSQPTPEALHQSIKKSQWESEGAKLVGEELAAGVTSGLSTGIETKVLGVNPEDIRGRREAHPIKAMLARTAGSVGQMALMPEFKAAQMLGAVGGAAAKSALEMAAFQTGDEVTKAFIHEPGQSIQSAVADIGLAAVLGAGFGVGAAGAKQLWKLGPGAKIEQTLAGLKNASEGISPELRAAAGQMQHEVPDYIIAGLGDGPEARRAFQVLAESNSSSGLKLQDALAAVKKDVQETVHQAINKSEVALAALRDMSDYEIGKDLQKSVNTAIKESYAPVAESYAKFENKFAQANIGVEERLAAQNKLTQLAVDEGWLKSASDTNMNLLNKVQEKLNQQANAADLKKFITNLADSAPWGSEQYRAGKAIRGILSDLQEETITKTIGREAPALLSEYQSTKAAYREIKGTLEALNDRLHVGKHGGPESFMMNLASMAPEDVARRLSTKGDVELQKMLAEKFPEVLRQVQQSEVDKLFKKSLDKTGDAIDVQKLAKNISSLPPELRQSLLSPEQLKKIEAAKFLLDSIPARMNASGTARTMDKLLNNKALAAAAMVADLMGGHGVATFVAGKIAGHLASEAPDHVRLAMLKFLGSGQQVSGEGFAALAKVAKAMYKAEKQTAKGVNAIYGGAKVIEPVSVAERAKLVKAIDAATADPSKLLEKGADIGHYAPEKAAELGMLTGRAISYLSKFKPKTAIESPIQNKRVASKAEEDQYNQRLDVAQRPLIVLNHIKDGTLTPAHVEAMQVMYPALYAKLQRDLMAKMADTNENLPYKTKLALSRFLGQPLENSISPASIQSAQLMNMAVQQPMMKQPSKTPQNALKKLPGMYQTPSEARAAHRAK